MLYEVITDDIVYEEFKGTGNMELVITSYSIHYTKLYDAVFYAFNYCQPVIFCS